MAAQEEMRRYIKEKARKRVAEANEYAKDRGSAASIAKGIIEIDPEKQKDAFDRFNGITYVAK